MEKRVFVFRPRVAKWIRINKSRPMYIARINFFNPSSPEFRSRSSQPKNRHINPEFLTVNPDSLTGRRESKKVNYCSLELIFLISIRLSLLPRVSTIILPRLNAIGSKICLYRGGSWILQLGQLFLLSSNPRESFTCQGSWKMSDIFTFVNSMSENNA